MKLLACCVLGVVCLVAGCGEKPQSGTGGATNAPAPASGVMAAPAEYLKSAAASQQRAVKTVDLTALDKAIQLFQVQEGRLPKDLAEVVAKKYIPEMPVPPVGYSVAYDAAKGTVRLEKN